MKTLVIIISIAFGLLRVFGATDDVFKDFAHVWVGILIGIWLTVAHYSTWKNMFGAVALILTVVETATAITRRLV